MPKAWVRFAGHVSADELISLYQSSWIVASASAREGWGMSLTEAAGCGTPAVANRITGHTDAVTDGVTGVLAGGTVTDLGGAIATVLTDDALRNRLAAAALAEAQQLTWESTAAGIMRILASTA